MLSILRIALDTPAAAIAGDGLYDYRWAGPAEVGQLVLAPFGSRMLVGLVAEITDAATIEPERLRDATAIVAGLSPLSSEWLTFVRFAARYYHRSLGEVALPSLPALLRRPDRYTLSPPSADGTRVAHLPSIDRAIKRAERETAADQKATPSPGVADPLSLNAMQSHALAVVLEARTAATLPLPILLYGVTGSGKTEVYLRAIGETIASGLQALVLVPEINLTPQLEDTFRQRLPHARVASLHSGHAEGRRLLQWWLAHEGKVDVLLGTRLAVMASLPRLGLIVVDEEHDASYKQQEGLRYSARDLAIVRAHQGRERQGREGEGRERRGHEGQSIPVVLASATPSMETWARAERGRYRKVVLSERASSDASLPTIRLVPLLRAKTQHGLTDAVRDAIADRVARREPVLVFHNRRGYAPVLACSACGWLSDCPRCSVHAVFHQADRRLHCHHCGWQQRVPRACPSCGNTDLAAIGRGTQRVEESLRSLFPSARIARIDRDSTRRKGAAVSLLDAVHLGDLDILVGTQMLAKGHDFRNVTLVCVLDADGALYSHDFRASERLFSNLMQVAGRAGRGGARSGEAEVLIQTRAPEHSLFGALVEHDFTRFAASLLDERRRAGLPPFSHQAVLRAEAKTAEDALAFLNAARAEGVRSAEQLGSTNKVTLYDPVPMTIARVAGVERAQLLVESSVRPALHAFLDAWLAALHAMRARTRWHIEIDPLDI